VWLCVRVGVGLGAVVDVGVCTYVRVGMGVEMYECCVVVVGGVCVFACARALVCVCASGCVRVFVNVGGCVQV